MIVNNALYDTWQNRLRFLFCPSSLNGSISIYLWTPSSQQISTKANGLCQRIDYWVEKEEKRELTRQMRQNNENNQFKNSERVKNETKKQKKNKQCVKHFHKQLTRPHVASGCHCDRLGDILWVPFEWVLVPSQFINFMNFVPEHKRNRARAHVHIMRKNLYHLKSNKYEFSVRTETLLSTHFFLDRADTLHTKYAICCSHFSRRVLFVCACALISFRFILHRKSYMWWGSTHFISKYC